MILTVSPTWPSRSCHHWPVSLVTATLADHWPTTLRTERLVLRPVDRRDFPVVEELLTSPAVRRHLGGPVPAERIAARQQGYAAMTGCFAIAPAAGGQAAGLVSIEADSRQTGRAENSYQLRPSDWGRGLGREAVAAVIRWWTSVAPQTTEVIAVTHESNTASRKLLEAVGMVLADTLVEYGARQSLYTLARPGTTVNRRPQEHRSGS